MRRAPQRVLVTGAGSGIGRALLRTLESEVETVCAVDRHFDEPEDTPRVRRLRADVLYANLVPLIGAVTDTRYDTVIHCAGVSAVGRFERLDPASLRRVVETNLLAPIRITRDLMQASMVTPDATHVFVASLSCFVGYPGASVYAASKDGLHAFARCLRQQVAGDGGRVMVVFPGPTDTPHARRYSPPGTDPAARMAPEAVATAIRRGIHDGKRAIVPRSTNRLAALAGILAPRTATRVMGRWLLPQLEGGPWDQEVRADVPALRPDGAEQSREPHGGRAPP